MGRHVGVDVHTADPSTERDAGTMAVVDRVVIGEAVELDVRTARLPSRALGLALDVLIMLVLLLVVLLVMSAVGADVDPALAAAVSLITTVGVFVGYPLLWETLTRGRSPGKYAMGLRVVRTDGGPIVFRHALARALAGFIVDFGLLSLFTGLIGIVVSASSAQGQRIGDLLAGTVVVRERLPRTGAREPPAARPRARGLGPGLRALPPPGRPGARRPPVPRARPAARGRGAGVVGRAARRRRLRPRRPAPAARGAGRALPARRARASAAAARPTA